MPSARRIFFSPAKKKFRWRKVKFRRRKILFYYIKSIFRRRNSTFRRRNIFFAGEKKIRRADGIGKSLTKNNIIYFSKQLLVLVPVMYVNIQKTVHFASKNVLTENMTITGNVSLATKIVSEVARGLKTQSVQMVANLAKKLLSIRIWR